MTKNALMWSTLILIAVLFVLSASFVLFPDSVDAVAPVSIVFAVLVVVVIVYVLVKGRRPA